ncbi:hypothetical protein VTK56DRAFT_7240 [Thermocarpiscus australiensis]
MHRHLPLGGRHAANDKPDNMHACTCPLLNASPSCSSQNSPRSNTWTRPARRGEGFPRHQAQKLVVSNGQVQSEARHRTPVRLLMRDKSDIFLHHRALCLFPVSFRLSNGLLVLKIACRWQQQTGWMLNAASRDTANMLPAEPSASQPIPPMRFA